MTRKENLERGSASAPGLGSAFGSLLVLAAFGTMIGVYDFLHFLPVSKGLDLRYLLFGSLPPAHFLEIHQDAFTRRIVINDEYGPSTPFHARIQVMILQRMVRWKCIFDLRNKFVDTFSTLAISESGGYLNAPTFKYCVTR
jgi:hypothetical protein